MARLTSSLSLVFRDAVLGRHSVPLWAILASLSPALMLVVRFVAACDTKLTNFRHRAIGSAIIHGVDPTDRVWIFVGASVLLAGLFSLFLLLFRAAASVLPAYPRRLLIAETGTLLLFSLFSASSTVLGVLTRYPVYFSVGIFLELSALFVALLGILKVVLYRRGDWRLVGAWFPRRQVVILGWLSPAIVYFAYWACAHGRFGFRLLHYWTTAGWYCLISLGYFLLIRCLVRRGFGKRQIDRSLVHAGLFLLLIPVSVPVANELQFALSGTMDLSPQWISVAVMAALVCSSLAAFAVSLRYECRIPSSSFIENCYFPLVVITLCVFYYHTHVLSWSELDLLHLGNGVVPAHQFLQFGRLPFVDQLPARGLFDVIPALLYSLVNGQRGLEGAMWIVLIHDTTAVLLLYLTFARIMGPLPALLTVSVLPILRLVEPYYAMALFPAVCFTTMIRKPRRANVALFLLATVFASAWMLAVGRAVVLCGAVLLAAFLLTRGRQRAKKILALLAAMTGSIAIFYLALLAWNAVSPTEMLSHVVAYARRDAFTAPRPAITGEHGPLAVIVYGIFPIVSLFYFLRFVTLLVRERETPRDYLLAFIALSSFVISLRGLTRHSLIEGFSPYFALLLLVSVPFILPGKTERKLLFSVCLSLAFLFVFPGLQQGTYRGHGEDRAREFLSLKTIVKPGEWFQFRHWKGKEKRFSVSGTQYAELKGFLDSHLKRDQTFFDFINGHLLYVLTDRESLFLQHSTLMLWTDLPQRLYVTEWEKLLENNRIPFVVFRCAGSWWWGDSVDDIPSPMAAYRVAEHIYRHYRPLTVLDGLEVWGLQTAWPSGQDAGLKRPLSGQHFDLARLPYLWAAYDEKQAAVRTRVLQEANLPAKRAVQKGEALTVGLDPAVDKSTGNYLHLELSAATPGTARILYGRKDPSSFTFALVPSLQPQAYLIRISSQWAWNNESIDSVVLESDVPVRVERVVVRKGD